MRRFDVNDAPRWDFRLTVRGVEVATLGPMEVGEATLQRAPTAAEARAARKPGAIVRLWRWIAGEPAPIDAVRADAETEHVRSLVLMFTPAAHHGLIRTLTGGELMVALAAYLGAQGAWCEAVQAAARAEAARAWERSTGGTPVPPGQRTVESGHGTGGTPVPSASPLGQGTGGTVRIAPVPLRHGAPPPAWLGGMLD